MLITQRDLIPRILLLSGSGAVVSLGLSLLLSGRIGAIGPQVVHLALFFTLQMLLVTVAKLGLDQYSFAAVSGDPTREISKGHAWNALTVCLCATGGVLAAWSNGILFGVCLSLSAFLDSMTLIRCAHWNARGRIFRVALSSVTGYPLYLLLVVACSTTWGFNLEASFALYVAVSLVRYCACSISYVAGTLREHVTGASMTFIVAFGVGNYVLHRMDQLGIALIGWNGVLLGVVANLQDYLLLARYFELISSAWPLVGAALFPWLFEVFKRDTTSQGMALLLLIPGLIAALAAFFYFVLWIDRTDLGPHRCLPFALSGIASFSANFFSYMLIRQGALRSLAIASVGSAIAVAALGWPMVLFGSLPIEALVPLGLCSFTTLAVASLWRLSQLFRHPA